LFLHQITVFFNNFSCKRLKKEHRLVNVELENGGSVFGDCVLII